MANTSCNETASRLLDECLRGESWQPELLDHLLREGCDEALFRIVAEGLADRFEPRLCRTYDEIFSRALGVAIPSRRTPPLREFRRIFVLSRVTLGADIAVTSVILDAAKRRFPGAEIYLVGPRKNWELFAADPRIGHVPIGYRRGTLRDRLSHWPELRAAVDHPDALVIDPDSRLTQLGLLPVCDPGRYLFFESRSYGDDGEESLPMLTARWCGEQFDICGAPYLAVARRQLPARPAIAISLGTGDNPNKRVADPFESELFSHLAATGAHLWIDAGAGGDEAARVRHAATLLPAGRTHLCHGSFADFAAIIAASDLYVGYDSAGQHAAAACRIPQVTIFAGEACERMFHRWRPAGHERIRVIRARSGARDIIKTASEAVAALWP